MNASITPSIPTVNLPCQTGDQGVQSTSSSRPISTPETAQPCHSLQPPAPASQKSTIHSNQCNWSAPAGGTAQYPPAPVYHSENVPQVSIEEADRQPWRYRGYPEMCKWTASDDDFFVLRRFGELSARVLLRLQDRIVMLEEDLQQLDLQCQKDGSDSGTFRYDPCEERQRLLDELTSRLDQYQRFMLDHAQIKARPEATEFQRSNVKNWFYNANGPIETKEANFINKDGDLIPVVPKIKTPLRRFIDKFEKPRSWPVFRARNINERLHKDTKDFGLTTTVYNKDAFIDKAVTCVAIILGVIMIVGPLWWLQQLSLHHNLKARLAAITGFLVLFTIQLSILTVARPFEVLAATAAYGAVLMVFMQISN